MSSTAREEDAAQPRNMVHLVGRVASAPTERELPSGDRITTFRIVVARERTPMTAGSRQVSDWVDCAVWSGRLRRTVRAWLVDDTVAVEGALRRRFFRGTTGAASRVEIEVLSGRRLARSR